jgi:magnesium chelatase family protein
MRPFRAPHHTASAAALVGGGSHPRPGEISLAHHGVLFLDELPEWNRRVLDVLREPIESGVIHISRAARQCAFPAQFQFVAAMNPCPCGWLGHPSGRCRCAPDHVARYRGRVSGPLVDRLDLVIDVPEVSASALMSSSVAASGETSAVVRERVIAAHAIQKARQGRPNARLTAQDIGHCKAEAGAEQLLSRSLARLSLSARAYHRTLKVARTIADLAGSATVTASDVAEAIQLRRFDRFP